MYELYMERFRITELRDGCVYATASDGCGWFPEDVVKGNRPAVTSVMYVAASDAFAQENCTIRKIRRRDGNQA